MTFAHMVVFLLALLMAGEAAWALLYPSGIRKQVGLWLEGAETENLALSIFAWMLALLLWWVAWYGQLWAHRVLFFAGVLFMLVGFCAQRPAFLKNWYRLCLGDRSPWMIRLIYAVELLIACGLGWLAQSGL